MRGWQIAPWSVMPKAEHQNGGILRRIPCMDSCPQGSQELADRHRRVEDWAVGFAVEFEPDMANFSARVSIAFAVNQLPFRCLHAATSHPSPARSTPFTLAEALDPAGRRVAVQPADGPQVISIWFKFHLLILSPPTDLCQGIPVDALDPAWLVLPGNARRHRGARQSERSVLEKSIAANSVGVKPEQSGLSAPPHPLPICALPCSLMR